MNILKVIFALYGALTLINILIIVKENLISDYVSKEDMVEPQVPICKAFNPFYLISKLFK